MTVQCLDTSADCSTRIHDYKLVQESLGEGTYSRVGLYERVSDGESLSVAKHELFAIKCMSRFELDRYQCPVYDGSGSVKVETIEFQVKRELEILRAIENLQTEAGRANRHIIRLEEVISARDCIYIVYPYAGHPLMEYVDSGIGYTAWIDSKDVTLSESTLHVFDSADVYECMVQILLGISLVHSAGVCHKDIKPENVLIMRPLSQWWMLELSCAESDTFSHSKPLKRSASVSNTRVPHKITICDFNTAEFVASENKIYDAQGTVLFTPPEAFIHSHDGINGFARDMWSIGVLGFVMLCGQLPVNGSRSLEIELKLLQLAMQEGDAEVKGIKVPEWIKQMDVSDNSKVLFELIERLLLVDPAMRPTASEALSLLN